MTVLNVVALCENVIEQLVVPPRDLVFRMLASLVPPVGKKFQKIETDLLGPLLIVTLLSCVLYCGRSTVEIFQTLLLYIFVTPVLCYMLLRVSSSRLSFTQTSSLLGYALFGHTITLSISLLFHGKENNFFFFICLIVFGGSSALRLVLIFLSTIPIPAARLLVCTFITIVHLLFLMFLHFTYMHTTFVYGNKMRL